MEDEKRIRDIMSHIDEYDKVDTNDRLCDVLFILRQNHERLQNREPGTFHKTLLVTDESKKIVGKLSVFDLIRGLVPEAAKEPGHSKSYYNVLSSRALRVADEVSEVQERFKWLHTSFFDLVVQETQKQAKDVMSPVHPLLVEEDSISKAIYIMFKENIRQPLVVRDDQVVGVVNIMDIFPVLLEIAGHECFINPDQLGSA